MYSSKLLQVQTYVFMCWDTLYMWLFPYYLYNVVELLDQKYGSRSDKPKYKVFGVHKQWDKPQDGYHLVTDIEHLQT